MKRIAAMLLCLCLLCGCTVMKELSDTELAVEGVYTFSDGETVDLYTFKTFEGAVEYGLSSGKRLLRVDYPGSYEVWADSFLPHWSTMTEDARQKVVEYLGSHGGRCTLDGEYAEYVMQALELSYGHWLSVQGTMEKDNFLGWYIAETVDAVASNDKILVFNLWITCQESWQAAGDMGLAVEMLQGKGAVEDIWQAEIFSVETGERIPIEDLFTVSPAEAAKGLLEVLHENNIGVETVDLQSVVPTETGFRVLLPMTETHLTSTTYFTVPYEHVLDIVQPWVLGLDDGFAGSRY